MISVTLSQSEVLMAAQVGILRRYDSLQKKLTDSVLSRRDHAKNSEWAFDIDGACAELAVAKAMGTYWSGHVGSFKEPDVLNLQVRSTSRHDGHLIIRENDLDLFTYVLVITDCPTYKIVGGISGRKAKQKEKRNADYNGDGAWWISQNELTDPKVIFDWVKSKMGVAA